MSSCHRCGKLVYFAERKFSLGKDWHRECLQCQECGKVLHPGQHAQHKGTPYCHVPCYSALFGPTMFGHGSSVDAHTNFGNQASKISCPVKRPTLEANLKLYNEHYEGKNLTIKSKEVNGRLVLEGPVRVHWGVQRPIQLQEKDASPVPKEWRRSYCLAINNGLQDALLQKKMRTHSMRVPSRQLKMIENRNDPSKVRRGSLEDLISQMSVTEEEPAPPSEEQKSNSLIRPGDRRRKKNAHKRVSIINGHLFDAGTSVFTPAHGSVTSVTISSLDTTPDVITHLLSKFKVKNNPFEYCLCVVKSTREVHVLGSAAYPLLERLMLGPLEDNAKIFIMEKGGVSDITEEVGHFVSLPDAVLLGFLHKLQQEELQELECIKHRYIKKQACLERQLSELSSTNL